MQRSDFPEAVISSLYRYPVKGFGGQRLESVDFVAGRGLAFDRFIGIANGQAEISCEGWTPCTAFVRLTRNPDLPLFKVDFGEDDMRLTLTSRDGDRVSVDLGDLESVEAANDAISAWFPHYVTPPRLARRFQDLGWWDGEDAPVSLINIETVRSLSNKAGRALDPLRFRGNLYVAGMAAWEEFGLLGCRVRIGDAELEFTRPIERCKATSVDPATGDADTNLPALLAGKEGHLFCGLYGRVVKNGRVRRGDQLERRDDDIRILRDGASYGDAPPPAKWPRFAKVVARERESRDVESFWLKDCSSKVRGEICPGQHIRVHLSTDGSLPYWRSYTVSGVDGDCLRISVKNEGTGVSRRLHEELAVEKGVLISGPFGAFKLAREHVGPLVLVSAGIGITPIVAMLREIVDRRAEYQSVHLLHSSRDVESAALWVEANRLIGQINGAEARLFASRAKDSPSSTNVHSGRMDAGVLQALPTRDANFYVCGPTAFMNDVRAWAIAAGAAAEAIHSEAFASPSNVKRLSKPTSGMTSARVNFSRHACSVDWCVTDGSLLDLAEASGLSLPANCRAGVCGSCRVSLLSGTVEHLVAPPFPLAPDDVLTCCAIPASDIEIDA